MKMESPIDLKLVKVKRDGIQILGEDEHRNPNLIIKKEYIYADKDMSNLGSRFLKFHQQDGFPGILKITDDSLGSTSSLQTGDHLNFSAEHDCYPDQDQSSLNEDSTCVTSRFDISLPENPDLESQLFQNTDILPSSVADYRSESKSENDIQPQPTICSSKFKSQDTMGEEWLKTKPMTDSEFFSPMHIESVDHALDLSNKPAVLSEKVASTNKQLINVAMSDTIEIPPTILPFDSEVNTVPTSKKEILSEVTFKTPNHLMSNNDAAYNSQLEQAPGTSSAWSTRSFNAMRTPSKIPSSLGSKSNFQTPLKTGPNWKATAPSQGFECLSISSILDEIGYERSQMQRILPQSASWKRKLVTNDIVLENSNTKEYDLLQASQESDSSDFQCTQEITTSKRPKTLAQERESSPDFEGSLSPVSVVADYAHENLSSSPEPREMPVKKFLSSSPVNRAERLNAVELSPCTEKGASSQANEYCGEEEVLRLNDTIDDYISQRIDALEEISERGQEGETIENKAKTSSISKKLSNKMRRKKGSETSNLSEECNVQTQMPMRFTSSNSAVEDIVGIDNLSEQDLEEVIESNELCFCLTFQGNFTSFQNTSAVSKETRIVRSMVIRAKTKHDAVKFVHIPIENTKIIFKLVNADRPIKYVFGAKNFVKILAEFLPEFDLQKGLDILDLQVGCWLMRSDKLSNTFQDCIGLVAPAINKKHFGTKQDIRQDLSDLSTASQQLMIRLEAEGLKTVFLEIEMKILSFLVCMELTGVQVNMMELERIGHLLEKEALRVETECISLAGVTFNLSSAKQVREVIYDKLKLDIEAGVKIGTTAGGVKSTCEASLKKLSHNKIPGLILKHRQLMKSQTAYVSGLVKHCSGQGNIHCTWDQIGAVTGRITSESPNLQAIPKSDITLEKGSVNIRRGFVSRPGFSLISADFEQIELRILAHLSGDPNLVRAINTGGDIFVELTAVWLEKPVNSVQSVERDKTKQVVYALMYGAGKQKLSEILDVTVEQAHNIIVSFYSKFSQVKSFQRGIVQRAQSHGYLVTMFGRKRSFPHINSNNIAIRIQAQRQAFNFLIQGTAADIMKKCLIQCQRNLSVSRLDAQLLLLVHDEIIWQVKNSELKTFKDCISASFQRQELIFPSGVQFKLDLKIKLSYGSNLADLERWHLS